MRIYTNQSVNMIKTTNICVRIYLNKSIKYDQNYKYIYIYFLFIKYAPSILIMLAPVPIIKLIFCDNII